MRYSLPIKIGAAVLSIVSCLLCAAGLYTSVYFADQGFYRQGGWNYYESYDCINQVYSYADTVGWSFYPESQGDRSEWMIKDYQQMLDPQNTNFRFELLDRKGNRWSESTYQGEEYGFHETFQYELYNSEYYTPSYITVEAYVVDPLTADDGFSSRASLLNKLYENREEIPAITAISGIVTLLLFIYLICAAGRKKDEAAVVVGGLHRVPFDLLSAVVLVLDAIILAIAANFGWTTVETGIGVCFGATTLYGLNLFYVMSLAIRCKAHTLWRSFLIYRIFRWIKEKWLVLYRNMSFLWKSVVVISGFALITLLVGSFCILVYDTAFVIFFWFYMAIASLALLALAVVFQLQYRRIQDGIRRIVSGDPAARIDTNGLYGDMKEQAENLNRIHASVQTAVEKQLKSERLKTELITNVSHDIKTPLTSIVNYVDLLKKQDVQDETAQEYIEVLDRQSTRLKKLIEDLMEASKASTGNINVNLAPLDSVELVKQVAGEYVDRLRDKGLELMVSLPQREVPVLADGQLLWRVFDNLLSNAQKYSQPGTRVYLDLQEAGGQVVVTFRNISAYSLNISGDELMERFVRGDSSRHTEGSGLGLSIARSLIELMNGHFGIVIDGDLFKAQVMLSHLPELSNTEKNCQG